MASKTLKFPKVFSACQERGEPNKVSPEIAGSGHDSLGGSLKLPDPWLFDSEALLRELARCRETALQIPVTNPNATHFGIQLAVSALWNLEQNLRYLLHLHRDGQRSFRRKCIGKSREHQTIYVVLKSLRITCWYISSPFPLL